MSDLAGLIARLEKATGPDRILDRDIGIAVLGWQINNDLSSPSLMINGDYYPDHPGGEYPSPTESFDIAMTLLPDTACNHDLYSFIGHGREDIGETAWGFTFHDTAQFVGAVRAKREVERLRKDPRIAKLMRGAPHIVTENAIAENFCEFSGSHAATPAIAVCIAALKARPTNQYMLFGLTHTASNASVLSLGKPAL